MLKLCSARAAGRFLARYDGAIRDIAERYALPAACLKAILYRELTDIDIIDPLADALVRFNLARGAAPGGGPLGKCDSSTGCGQIFARVAINAINFAVDRGLTDYAALGLPNRRPDGADTADLRLVWTRLHDEPVFNMECTALNLLAAAQEITGRTDFASFTPEELKRVFTRYNGTLPGVTPYGEAVYRHYLRFCETE